MKYTLRIPLDQFAYIEYEGDFMSFEDSLVEYYRNVKQFKGGEGLSDKEFSQFIDNQLLGNNKNHIDQYEKASTEQKFAIQVLKRGLKRITPTKEE